MRATAVCSTPDCPRPATARGRCADHARQARHDTRSGAPAQTYNHKWRHYAARYLRAHPTCQCHFDCTEPAEVVHHIDHQGPTGPRGFDPTNLVALSRSCPASRN